MILVFKTNSIIDSYRNTLEPNYSKRSNTSHRVLKSQILTLLLTSDDCKHVPPEHMHIILFHDAIKDGRLAAILVVKKKNWCRTRPQPFLGYAFSDVVQTWQTDNGCGFLTEACHFLFEIRSKMADWLPFSYLNMSPTISQTCMIRFCTNLAQAQYMMAYTCTSLYFAMWSKMADLWTGSHFHCT